jgi:hypothetical protein
MLNGVRMKFCSLLLVLFIVSCASNNINSKSPEFNVTKEQIKSLHVKFKDSDYDILSLQMIDRQGNVVKSKLISWDKRRVDETTAKRFSLQMPKALKFSEDNKRETDYLLLPYGFNIDKKFDFN